MASWFYTRLLILPGCIWFVFKQKWVGHPQFAESTYVTDYFSWLLGCLNLLHAFWFIMFIKILKRYVKVGEKEDI
jgi:hypothetical protein